MGSIRGHVTYFLKFWDPLHISGTADARSFKFGTQIGHKGPKPNDAKLGQKVSIRGQVTYILKFWGPFHISGTVEARNLKFGTHIGHLAVLSKKMQN